MHHIFQKGFYWPDSWATAYFLETKIDGPPLQGSFRKKQALTCGELGTFKVKAFSGWTQSCQRKQPDAAQSTESSFIVP